MITIHVTVTSERPGHQPVEPDIQTYTSYERAAQGMQTQGIITPVALPVGIDWRCVRHGVTTTARLVQGDKRRFDRAMWVVADLSVAARQLAEAREALGVAMSWAERVGRCVVVAGRPQAVTARELGVERMTVRKWVQRGTQLS